MNPTGTAVNPAVLFLTKMERHYIYLASTESTNNDLKARIAAADGPVFDVIAAKTQTGGRGRLGRSFFSPPGGLYFSVALPLGKADADVSCLTLTAGLSVCTALEDLCGIAPRIKWPNDLYLNGKKLCGILCELVSGHTPTAVVGIGVNLNARPEEIPAELKEKMTSLRAEGVTPPPPEALIKTITEKLDRAVYEDRALTDRAAMGRCLEQIRKRSFLDGKTVCWTVNGETVSGIFRGVADNGAALLQLPDGTIRAVVFGEITVR